MNTLNADCQGCLSKDKMRYKGKINLKKRNTFKPMVGRFFWNMKIDQKALRESLEITFWK